MTQSSPPHPAGKTDDGPRPGTPRTVRQADFWISVLVLAFVVDFFITVAAVCYGIIVTPPREAGAIHMAFPWMGWMAAMLAAPALLIGLARVIAARSGQEAPGAAGRDEAWARQLPAKALRLYRFANDAPLFVICLALLLLGATLIAVDSAFSLVSGIALALVPYLPWFIAALTVLGVAITGFAAYFRYRNNKLAAEYAFRREVLHTTGIVLVDPKDSVLLPPGTPDGHRIGRIAGKGGDGPVLETTPVKALPQGDRNPPDGDG